MDSDRSRLVFTPELEVFVNDRTARHYTCLAGRNNTGKSLVLKYLKFAFGKHAYMVGVNRFYHVHQFGSGLRDPNELEQFETNFINTWQQEGHNPEQNFFDLNRVIIGLNNKHATICLVSAATYWT